MLRWIRVQRPCMIDNLKKNRNKGGAHIYLLALMIIVLLLLVFKMMIDRERLYITYDNVDDALIESLLAACTINTEEYGVGGHTVIYRTITPEEEGFIPGLGKPIEKEPFDPLDNPDIYSPYGDYYLNRSYDAFLRVLKQNLGLDDVMEARISGIDGIVNIDEFSIYNVYRSFDDDGNQIGYRVVKYTRTDGGGWYCYPYGYDTPVDVYNSIDHYTTSITETSVSATISFNVRITDGAGAYNGTLTDADFVQNVSYSRIVDVKSH